MQTEEKKEKEKSFLNSIELEREHKSEHWETDVFIDWKAIRSNLTYKDLPDIIDCSEQNPRRGITVILPKDDIKPELNFSFLKGDAYFPYELDPK